MAKKIWVSAPEIWNKDSGQDPDNDLEIFGELYARRMTLDFGDKVQLDSKSLFYKDSGNRIILTTNSVFKNPQPAQMLEIGEDPEYLALVVSLQEHDNFGKNDPLLGELKIHSRDIGPGFHVVSAKYETEWVDVVFRVDWA